VKREAPARRFVADGEERENARRLTRCFNTRARLKRDATLPHVSTRYFSVLLYEEDVLRAQTREQERSVPQAARASESLRV